MTGRQRLAVAGGILAVAGCDSSLVPSMPEVAGSVAESVEGTARIYTVSPWPLDNTAAFLCHERPGAEFTGDSPVPAEDAGCVPLDVTTARHTLRATFDSAKFGPEISAAFDVPGPWFLAIAGERGRFSAATVVEVFNSPIYSPHGPS
jgi:hypothetical protein